MKYLKFISILVLTLVIASCNNDDDSTPDPVNEEEIITSVIVTLESDTETIVLSSRDLDGDGPNDPDVISGNLQAGTTYQGTVQFLNETESPADNITLEVIEEADEHQVFFIPGSGLDVTVDYLDSDGDGNPLGVQFSLTTGSQGNGNMNITLRHEPTKPNDGTLADAGGETDISVNFDVVVE